MTGPSQQIQAGSLRSSMASSLPDPPVWPPGAQWCMAILASVGLALIAWRGYGLTRFSTQPLPLQRAPVDLNQADEIDLCLLPGIGPVLAKRILEHRPFRSVEELRSIPGIGSETFRKLQPHVCVDPESLPPRVVRAKPNLEEDSRSIRKESPNELLDLNNASEAELVQLPGVGPILARRIIEARPFVAIEDLLKVKGIGTKTFAKIKPYVTVKE